ncbi:hypothetical protein M0802_002639 [Mischocyttarus mexicanus]|nr:hypothetical protein M0802_002639 [Mischocyttarus mexicanus]
MEVTTSSSTKNENEPSEELSEEYLPTEDNCENLKEILNKSFEIATKKCLKEKIKNLPRVTIYGKELFIDLESNDEFVKKAEIELRETPEIVAESYKTLRELVKEDKYLCVPDREEFYIKFLRPCKWYPKSAFHLMQRCYQFRLNYPYVYENLSVKTVMKTICSEIMFPLPVRCIDGSRLFIVYSGSKWNPKEFSVYDLFKCLLIILEGALLESKTQIAGAQVIIDANGLTLSHVTYITPRFAAMLVGWVQKCVPCRLKRIVFHGKNREKLVSMIGEKALPKEYGGSELVYNPIGDNLLQFFTPWKEELEVFLKCGYYKKNNEKNH